MYLDMVGKSFIIEEGSPNIAAWKKKMASSIWAASSLLSKMLFTMYISP